MKTLYYNLLISAVILLISIFTFSCDTIHEGVVVNRYIIPAHPYQYTTTVIIGKTQIPQWHTGYIDDQYILVIQGVKNNDTITKEFIVSKKTYDSKTKGDTFNDKNNQ